MRLLCQCCIRLDNDCYLEYIRKQYLTKCFMPLRDIPEPKLVMLDGGKDVPPLESVDIRELRVKEFLQARSLAPKTEKAYRQDLKYFLEWSNISWGKSSKRDTCN